MKSGQDAYRFTYLQRFSAEFRKSFAALYESVASDLNSFSNIHHLQPKPNASYPERCIKIPNYQVSASDNTAFTERNKIALPWSLCHSPHHFL